MTAGTADEKTYEVKSSNGAGNGVFTRAFLNAAKTGLADKSNDGFMTVDEIFAQIQAEVAEFSVKYKQKLTPQRWSLDVAQYRGAFVFVNPEASSRNIALANEYSQKFNARPRGEAVAAYGSVRLISYLTGKVFIDEVYVDDVESGDAKDYDLPVGQHTIAVKGSSETKTATVAVAKGKFTQVTIRPNEVGAPGETAIDSKPAPKFSFRKEPISNLSREQVKAMLKQHDFFCVEYDWNKEWSNPQGPGHSKRVCVAGGRRGCFRSRHGPDVAAIGFAE